MGLFLVWEIFVSIFLLNKISLCSPNWPWTHRECLCLCLWVLGLEMSLHLAKTRFCIDWCDKNMPSGSQEADLGFSFRGVLEGAHQFYTHGDLLEHNSPNRDSKQRTWSHQCQICRVKGGFNRDFFIFFFSLTIETKINLVIIKINV